MKISESQLRDIIKETIQQEIRAYVPEFENPEKFDGMTFDEALINARNDWFKDNEVGAKQYKNFKIIVVKQSWSTLFLIFKDDKFVTYVNESHVPDVDRFIVHFINSELQEKEPESEPEQEQEPAYSLAESKIRQSIRESIKNVLKEANQDGDYDGK